MVEVKQDHYLSQFEAFIQKDADQSPGWMQATRRSAMTRFRKLGFPTTRDEEWRFTSLTPLTQCSFVAAGMPDSETIAAELKPFAHGEGGSSRLVFINARFSREHSSLGDLPKGVKLQGLAESLQTNSAMAQAYLSRYAPYQEEVFTALNTAFLQDGALIHLPRNTVMPEPIHLLFFSSGNGRRMISHPRCLVVAGENSRVQIVETYLGSPESIYFTNSVTEVVAEDGAVVEHYKLQQESVKAFHIATLQLQLGRSSTVSAHSISLGGALVRNHVNAVLGGEDAKATLNGFSITGDGQHVDNHTSIDHIKPNCNSFEFYKGILDGNSSGVFNGRIIVRPNAQKTDSKQTNQNLLLSEDASVNTNPQLEIYADDVKCTHGATIGQLDSEAIFYLRSRGVDLKEARRLLTFAFANDIISQIQIESIRCSLEKTLFHRLTGNPPGK